MTPGAGSWRGLTLGDMDECSQVQGQGGRQPGNCRYLTPDTVSGWGFTLETVDMRPRCRIWVGMSSWIFCKCDLRYRVWRVSSEDGRYLTPGTGSGRGFTLETVDM